MNVSSFRELEARSAAERKKLMGSLLNYLVGAGINADLATEPVENFLGDEVQEPVINLKGQNLKKISLLGFDNSGCNLPGNVLRFQYLVSSDRDMSRDEKKDLTAYTKAIRNGKVMGFLGGKVTGITWEGQKLAAALNGDKEIADNMMKCLQKWSHLEFQIEAVSPREVYITGPRFSNPGAIADLYNSADSREDIQCCAFGFPMVEKMAGHIKNILT